MRCQALPGSSTRCRNSPVAARSRALRCTQDIQNRLPFSGCIKSKAISSLPVTVRNASLHVAHAQAIPVDSVPASSTGGGSDILDAVIVGAGISGLTTGQALAAKHASQVPNFLITEGRERVGGNITSREGNGFLWEEGPNSFQPNDSMLQIAVDAGAEKELVFGDPTAPRFVFWENKLRKTPSGPDALTFDLLSIWGKIRAGLGAIGIKPGMPEYEESVEQFIRRNLGAEVFERLIEPFCSGVYAGNPAKLGMEAAFGRIWGLEKDGGSLVGGAIKLFQERKNNPGPPRDPRLPPKPKGQTVGSFRKGLMSLPSAIAAKLEGKIRLNWQLQEITKDADGIYTLKYNTPEGAKQIRSRTVALTVPSYIAADILGKTCPKTAEALNSFDYPPVAAVTVAYPVSAVLDDRKDSAGAVPGFGQLHPRSQGVVTLGTIYSSSLFPGRAPEEYILLLNYIGGATNRGIVNQSEDELVAQVDKDLRRMLIKKDAPAAQKVGVRVWPKAIPQFNVGHNTALKQAKEGLKAAGWDGVLLGGNYVSGVALGKCVEYGYEFAGMVAEATQKSKTSA